MNNWVNQSKIGFSLCYIFFLVIFRINYSFAFYFLHIYIMARIQFCVCIFLSWVFRINYLSSFSKFSVFLSFCISTCLVFTFYTFISNNIHSLLVFFGLHWELLKATTNWSFHITYYSYFHDLWPLKACQAFRFIFDLMGDFRPCFNNQSIYW